MRSGDRDISRGIGADAMPGIRPASIPEPLLVQQAYPGAVPVCTDQFLNLSRDSYPPPWLVREIVQNFVDGNPERGTLDGVGFEAERVAGGATRFTITGNWPFEDPTGLTSMHTGKVADATRGKKTAGGNGIGLKQTVLRFLRDYDVSSFAVDGEGWRVTYRLIPSEEINEKLGGRENKQPVRNDWLVAGYEKTANTGRNRYIVETKDPVVARALREFPNMGVSDENPFLTDPDFENEHGVIKWLLPREGATDADTEFASGRLYLNGQVMQYGNASTKRAVWDSMEGVTLALHDVAYQMSIDRAALDGWTLSRYALEFVRSMRTPVLIDQLKRSILLWSGNTKEVGWYGGEQAYNALHAIIVDELADRSYGRTHFERDFGDKYLCYDRTLLGSDTAKLQGEGYIFCPSFFSKLGIPNARTKLTDRDAARHDVPTFEGLDFDDLATSRGIPVNFLEMEASDLSELVERMYEPLADSIASVELDEQRGVVRIVLNKKIDSGLFSRALSHPATEEQKLLHALRGIAYYGLDTGLCDHAVLHHPQHLTTFGLWYDHVEGRKTLIVKNIQSPADTPVVLELELKPEHVDIFREHFQHTAGQPGEEPAYAEESEEGEEEDEWEDSMRESRTVRSGIHRIMRSTGVAFGTAAALILAMFMAPPVLRSLQGGKEKAIQAYDDWRDSQTKYEVKGASGGEELSTFVWNREDRSVPVSVRGMAAEFVGLLESIVKQLSDLKREVEKEERFEVVQDPTPIQLKQMQLLRMYFDLATGTSGSGDFYLFRGEGKKGINIGGGIGIHEGMLQGDFAAALGTYAHERAHDVVPDPNHGQEFDEVNGRIVEGIISRLSTINAKLTAGVSLTEEEEFIVRAQGRWNSMHNDQRSR